MEILMVSQMKTTVIVPFPWLFIMLQTQIIIQEDINEAIVIVPQNLIDSFYENSHLDGTMSEYSILFKN
jgi:hypothetical protein